MAEQSRVDAIREMTEEYFTSNNPEFMKLELAIEVVLDLARENQLSEHDTDGDDKLEREQQKQETAIGTVEDFFTNNVFDGTD